MYLRENKLYLSTLKKFKLMKVRMKISYSALVKGMTVKELILDSILETYVKLNKLGLIKNPFEQGDDEFFLLVIQGKADLKLMIWHNCILKGELGQSKKLDENDPKAALNAKYLGDQ